MAEPASTFGHPSPYLGSLHNLGPGRAADVSVRPADVQHVRVRMSADNRLSACRNLLGSEVPYIAARSVYHGAIDLLPDCDDPLMASVVVTWTDGNGERMQKFKIPLNHDLV